MIATILDAALRSLLLAILVWSALRIFRVRNVLAERAAWAAVLASALVMPAVLPLSARWSVFPAEKLIIPSNFVRTQSSSTPAAHPASVMLIAGDGSTTVLAAPD